MNPRLILLVLVLVLPAPAPAATVTGNLRDISIQNLNTKLTFAPTTNVLVTASGLSAGPPKVLDTSSGAFSLTLEAGDYTVSLPLIPWRAPFRIFVPDTNGTINITNLLVVSHYPGADGPPRLLHANTSRTTAWSTNSPSSLLDTPLTLPAGTLAAGRVITFTAYGSFDDPAANSPSVTFVLKLGTSTLATVSRAVSTANWYLQASITVRSAGPSGTVVASLTVPLDNATAFPIVTQTTTVATTTPLTLALTAVIEDFTATESVSCDQLSIQIQ